MSKHTTSVGFTFDQAVLVEEQTRGQAKSRIWFDQRAEELQHLDYEKLCIRTIYNHLFH